MANRRSGGTDGVSVGGSLLDLVGIILISALVFSLWESTAWWAGLIRVLLGVPFVLLLPGYAVTAALFPGLKTTSPWKSSEPTRFAPTHVSGLERLVLSVGLSIFIVPLLGLFLNFTSGGITPEPFLRAILGLIVGFSLLAVVRRYRLPRDQRFGIRYGLYLQAFRQSDDRTKQINVVIFSLLLLSVGVAGSVLAMPGQGEQYTEFYLLTENEETGELVADGYPARIAPDESESVFVGLVNQEGRSMNYTVVVEIHKIRALDGEQIVVARSELDRYQVSLEPDESDVREQAISVGPGFAGDQVRVTFLLYTDDVSETPIIDRAYRTTTVWIQVSPGAGGDQ